MFKDKIDNVGRVIQSVSLGCFIVEVVAAIIAGIAVALSPGHVDIGFLWLGVAVGMGGYSLLGYLACSFMALAN